MWTENDLFQLIDSRDPAGLSRLAASGDAASVDSLALRLAASDGLADWVAALAPLSDPRAMDGAALCNAASAGHADCVLTLIKHIQDASIHTEAFRLASLMGHPEVIRILGPLADARGAGALALEGAVDSQDIDALWATLDFCEPSARKCEALKKALVAKRPDMVRAIVSKLPAKGPHWAETLLAAIKGDDAWLVEKAIGLGADILTTSDMAEAYSYSVDCASPKSLGFLIRHLDWNLLDDFGLGAFKRLRDHAYSKHVGAPSGHDECLVRILAAQPLIDRHAALELCLRNRWGAAAGAILVESAHPENALHDQYPTFTRRIEKLENDFSLASGGYGYEFARGLRDGIRQAQAVKERFEILAAAPMPKTPADPTPKSQREHGPSRL